MAKVTPTPVVRTDGERRMLEAIDAWYSANYHTGTRMSAKERTSLARYLAQRMGA